MEPRPTPRWPRGTCFAWGPSRNRREGSMLVGHRAFILIASQWNSAQTATSIQFSKLSN